MLKQLSKLTPIRVKFKSSDVDHKLFRDIKPIVSWNDLLAYQSFNCQFNIQMDARNIQLGAIII